MPALVAAAQRRLVAVIADVGTEVTCVGGAVIAVSTVAAGRRDRAVSNPKGIADPVVRSTGHWRRI
jgi:hypothetical protein